MEKTKPTVRIGQKKKDAVVAEQAVIRPCLLIFTDGHHLNFGTSSFSILKPSFMALQKNEEITGAGFSL